MNSIYFLLFIVTMVANHVSFVQSSLFEEDTQLEPIVEGLEGPWRVVVPTRTRRGGELSAPEASTTLTTMKYYSRYATFVALIVSAVIEVAIFVFEHFIKT